MTTQQPRLQAQFISTIASAALTARENPWYVAQQLGHVDVQLVFTTYGKFIPQDYQKPRLAALRVVGDK